MTRSFMQTDAITAARIKNSFPQETTIEAAERGVKRKISVCLTRHQFSALVSFLVSVGGREFERSDVCKLTNRGLHALAADAFLDYCYDENGKLSEDLMARRKYERFLYLSPVTNERRGGRV